MRDEDKRSSNEQPLNEIIDKFLKAFSLEHKMKEYDVIENWPVLMGKAVAFRTKEWDRAFEKHINKLKETKEVLPKEVLPKEVLPKEVLPKEVIVCGDLNVAHKEKDLKNPKTNLKTAGYTIEERTSFDKILETTGL